MQLNKFHIVLDENLSPYETTNSVKEVTKSKLKIKFSFIHNLS